MNRSKDISAGLTEARILLGKIETICINAGRELERRQCCYDDHSAHWKKSIRGRCYARKLLMAQQDLATLEQG